MSRILIGISGSVAAYKIIDIGSLFKKAGHSVGFVLTKSAEEFITVTTLKSLFGDCVYTHNEEFLQSRMLHIDLSKEYDLLLICPATANIIGKIANGIGDCLLTTLCLVFNKKILIAPAMNKQMWANPFVLENVSKLKEKNYNIIGPAFGEQACGDVGFGRLENIDTIFHFTIKELYNHIYKDKTILITLGATIEKIDPVRYISNFSSGLMGFYIALSAFYMGAKVKIIAGKISGFTIPNFFDVLSAESASEFLKLSEEECKNVDAIICVAAVSDFHVTYNENKIKKESSCVGLTLIKNEDILQYISKKFPDLIKIGFALETQDHRINAIKKLQSKNLDAIVLNDGSNGEVFGSYENEIEVFFKNNPESIKFKKNTKQELARLLLESLEKIINQ